MAIIDLNMADAMSTITLEVRIVGRRVASARLWLAAQIMKLAGLVAGCEIRIEVSQEFDAVAPLPRYRSFLAVGDVEIPRQASVRYGSPLFADPGEWGRKVDFYLDGVKQENVVSYDLDAGYVRVTKCGSDGTPLIVGDEVATEIRRGHLEAMPASADK